MANSLVKFLTGTAAQYSALRTKDDSTLYFISDSKQIRKGEVLYGGGNYYEVTELPATGEVNSIYLNTTDQSVSFYDGTKFVTVGQSSAISDLESRVSTLEGDSSTAGSVAKALADAKAYADSKASAAQTAAEKTASDANDSLKTELEAEIDKKANSATTLADYGITAEQARTELDVYTKSEADTAISTAVANADHLKRSIVDTLPEVADADENTIYMVPQNGATTGGGTTGVSSYNEYMIVNGAFELIGSSNVVLDDYYTKSETDSAISTAKSEAVNTASSDATAKANQALTGAKTYADGLASNYDAAGDADQALADAKTYADGLASNYATAAQGTKADTALQNIVAGANISVVTTDANDSTVSATSPKVSVTGLGTAAYAATGDFATAAQGAKADTAVQSVTETAETGTNGTITVDGTEVAVKGLGTAAYTATGDYATALQGTKADSALQASDITAGSENGTIAVKGTDVEVKGLGSAAYTSSASYATAAQGVKADTAIQSVVEGTTNGTIAVDGTDVAVHGLGSAAYTASTAYATAAQGAKADTALQVTTLTAGDYVTLENNGTANVTVGVTGVATSTQGSKADSAYEALTWGTIA